MSAGRCSHDNVAEVDTIGCTGVHLGRQCQDCGRVLDERKADRGEDYAVLGVDWYSDVRGKRWAS